MCKATTKEERKVSWEETIPDKECPETQFRKGPSLLEMGGRVRKAQWGTDTTAPFRDDRKRR